MEYNNGIGNTGSLTIRDGSQSDADDAGRGTQESKATDSLESRRQKAIALASVRPLRASRPQYTSRAQVEVMLAKRDEAQREWDLFMMEDPEPLWNERGAILRARSDRLNSICVSREFRAALAKYLLLVVFLGLIQPTQAVNVTAPAYVTRVINVTQVVAYEWAEFGMNVFLEYYVLLAPFAITAAIALIIFLAKDWLRKREPISAPMQAGEFADMDWTVQGTVQDARSMFYRQAENYAFSVGMRVSDALDPDPSSILVTADLSRLSHQEQDTLFARGQTVLVMQENPLKPAYQCLNESVTYDGRYWRVIGNGQEVRRDFLITDGQQQNLTHSVFSWSRVLVLWLLSVYMTFMCMVQREQIRMKAASRHVDTTYVPTIVTFYLLLFKPHWSWVVLVPAIQLLGNMSGYFGITCYDTYAVDVNLPVPTGIVWGVLLYYSLLNWMLSFSTNVYRRLPWWLRIMTIPFEFAPSLSLFIVQMASLLIPNYYEWKLFGTLQHVPYVVECPVQASMWRLMLEQWLWLIASFCCYSLFCWDVGTVRYDVQQVEACEGKCVRLYIPKYRRGFFSTLYNIRYATPRKRVQPQMHTANGQPAMMMTSVDDTGTPMRSMAMVGSLQSVTCTEEEFSAVVSIAASTKGAPSSGTLVRTTKQHTGRDLTSVESGLIVQMAKHVASNYHHSNHLEPFSGYTVEPTVNNENRPAMWAFARHPFPGAAAVPNMCLDNEQVCVQRRVLEQQQPPKRATVRFLDHCRELTDYLLQGKPRLRMYANDAVDSVRERQSTPGQQLIIDRAEYDYTDHPFQDTELELEPFMKRECYDEIGKDARNITPLKDRARLAASVMSNDLKELYKTWPMYAFGMHPQSVADRMVTVMTSAVARGNPNVVETDFSRFDGSQSKAMRHAHRMFFLRAYEDDQANDVRYILSTLYGNTCKTKFGTKYKQGYDQASGDPFTSFGNTLSNKFSMYHTLRTYGASQQEAIDHMGIYGGDDGVTACYGEPEKFIKHMSDTLANLGYKIKPLLRTLNEPVTFLARYYGPDVWHGDDNSMTDPTRALRGFFLTTMPTDTNPHVVARCKAMSARVFDLNTPLVGAIAKHYLRITNGVNMAKHKALVTSSRSFNEAWAHQYDDQVDITDDVQWIVDCGTIVKNEEADWMWDVLHKQLGVADLTHVFNWLKTDEFSCPPFVGQIPVLPKEDNVINGVLVPRDHLAEVKTNDPLVKQAVLQAVERQQGEEDALAEFDDLSDDEAGPPPPIKAAIRSAEQRADVAHLQRDVGPSTPGKSRTGVVTDGKERKKLCRYGYQCKKKETCQFHHQQHSGNKKQNAPVCRDFLTGKCKWKKCKFPHVAEADRTKQPEPTLTFAQMVKGKQAVVEQPSGKLIDDGAGVGGPSGGPSSQ